MWAIIIAFQCSRRGQDKVILMYILFIYTGIIQVDYHFDLKIKRRIWRISFIYSWYQFNCNMINFILWRLYENHRARYIKDWKHMLLKMYFSLVCLRNHSIEQISYFTGTWTFLYWNQILLYVNINKGGWFYSANSCGYFW